jgi:hypothetical protein
MSSFFLKLISWAKQSPAVSAAKQAAVAELTDAFQQAANKVQEHSPDFMAQAEPLLAQALSASLAGVLTKSK